jgi:hypothetical protein
MGDPTVNKPLFQATFFDAKLGAEPRTVLVRAASFVEAEAVAGKLGAHHSGILIESAPAELPSLEPRTRNGVAYLVERWVQR